MQMKIKGWCGGFSAAAPRFQEFHDRIVIFMTSLVVFSELLSAFAFSSQHDKLIWFLSTMKIKTEPRSLSVRVKQGTWVFDRPPFQAPLKHNLFFIIFSIKLFSILLNADLFFFFFLSAFYILPLIYFPLPYKCDPVMSLLISHRTENAANVHGLQIQGLLTNTDSTLLYFQDNIHGVFCAYATLTILLNPVWRLWN